MQRLEWTHMDKTEWPDGPWKSEPDKLQWPDEATGLPCLIKRNPVGALCGYVGVTSDHPYYQQDYDSVNLDAHGGLTFAAGCVDLDWLWDTSRNYAQQSREEAEQYPKGDAAQFLAEWGALLNDREAFNKHAQATAICHVPDEGEPDDIWWFGFDCAHAGDLCPGMPTFVSGSLSIRADVYRDLSYVKNECALLARQLKAAADSALVVESL
jgi:hypothetical protein